MSDGKGNGVQTQQEPVQQLVIQWYPAKGGLMCIASDETGKPVSLPTVLGLLRLANDFYENALKAGAQQAVQPRVVAPGAFSPR